MTNPDPTNPHEASRRFHEKFEHLPAIDTTNPYIGPNVSVAASTDPVTCTDHNTHIYGSHHEPGHLVYWVRTCMVCHRVDWPNLDDEIRQFIGERLKTFMLRNGDTQLFERSDLYHRLRSLFELEKLVPESDNGSLTNPEESDTL